MAGKARDWVRQIKNQSTFWFNYPPALPVRLGDIVVKEGGVWVPIGNTEDRGVTPEVEIDDSRSGAPWVVQSETGVQMESAVEADPGVFQYVQPGHAGVKVSLESGNKYLLSLAGVRFNRVKSIEQYWDDVRAEYSPWTWDLRRRIVTTVCQAKSGTFLGSGSSAATYELQAEAGVNVQGIDFGDISAKFQLKSTASSAETFSSLTDVTPLFRLHKLTLIGDFDVASLKDDIDPNDPPVEMTELVEDASDADDED